MGKSAFRTNDSSICTPDAKAGTSVGGSPDVFINGKHAVRLRDGGVYPPDCASFATPWRARQGATMVLANTLEMVHIELKTAHPHGDGTASVGSPDVIIGGPTVDLFERARADGLAMLDGAEAALLRWNAADRAHFKKWFGEDSEEARQAMLEKIRKMRPLMENADIVSAEGSEYASVDPSDPSVMKLKDKFWKSERTGSDNQGGVILHATSHYVAGGDTDDHVYGRSDAKQLAKDDPDKAQNNADNMEYWAEDL
jgi:uncharacterized Zn-binding protein involved in type VI secretion